MKDLLREYGSEIERLFPKFLLGLMVMLLFLPFAFVFMLVAHTMNHTDAEEKELQCQKYDADGWDPIFNVCYTLREDGKRDAQKIE